MKWPFVPAVASCLLSMFLHTLSAAAQGQSSVDLVAAILELAIPNNSPLETLSPEEVFSIFPRCSFTPFIYPGCEKTPSPKACEEDRRTSHSHIYDRHFRGSCSVTLSGEPLVAAPTARDRRLQVLVHAPRSGCCAGVIEFTANRENSIIDALDHPKLGTRFERCGTDDSPMNWERYGVFQIRGHKPIFFFAQYTSGMRAGSGHLMISHQPAWEVPAVGAKWTNRCK